MSIDLSQFYKLFFEETAEHLAEMETLLLALDVAQPSMDDLNAIFRAAHSIKGGAATFGFSDMTDVTHILETLLDKLRKQEMTLTVEMVNAFLEAGDVISMQLARHRGEGEEDTGAVLAVCEKLARLTVDLPVSVQPAVSEDLSYGLFTETEAEQAKQEDEQGFGFFVDIPDPVAVAGAVTPQSSAPVTAEKAPETHCGRRAMDAEGAEGVRTGKRATDKVVTSQAEATSIRVGVENI